jgi:hypothetical protein
MPEEASGSGVLALVGGSGIWTESGVTASTHETRARMVKTTRARSDQVLSRLGEVGSKLEQGLPLLLLQWKAGRWPSSPR